MVETPLFPTVVLAHSRSRHRMRHVADRVQAAKSRLISSKGTIIGGYALLFSTAPMIRIYVAPAAGSKAPSQSYMELQA